MTEMQEQQFLIKWAQQPSVRQKWPELALLYHVPNERYCSPVMGKNLKLSGVKRGVPDLCLPVARGGYHGLYIEMKTAKGRLSPEQKWWLKELNGEQYRAVLCRGWREAAAVLEEYLEG